MLQEKDKGIWLSLLTGVTAFSFAYFFKGVNALLLALISGMVLGNLLNLKAEWRGGISKSAGKLLEYSLLFLAFDISFQTLGKLGFTTLGILLGALAAVLILTVYFSRQFNCEGSTGWLIGFGTAICGSSAIAALSPSVTEKKEDIGIAMAVVNLLGATGMLVFPWFLTTLSATPEQAGILIGGALHSVGNVAGAAYGMNAETGGVALMVKMARVAMLSPALLFIRYLITRQPGQHWLQYLSLPWYLYAFIGIGVLNSFFPLPGEIKPWMEVAGKLTLTLAMAGIGFAVSFKTLYQSGRKGLAFGLFMFALQIAFFALMLLFI